MTRPTLLAIAIAAAALLLLAPATAAQSMVCPGNRVDDLPPTPGGRPGKLFLPNENAARASAASRSGARTARPSQGARMINGINRTTSGARTARGGSARLSTRVGFASTANSGPAPRPDWEAWWDDHRHQFLWDARRPRGPITVTGRGAPPAPRPRDHAPGRPEVYTTVVPRLLELVAVEDDPALLCEAALALGRAVEPPFDTPAAEALVGLLAHPDLGVQTSAAMALGVLGSDDGVAPLVELAACSRVGHLLCGASEVPASLRATASLALGMLDHPATAGLLAELARDLPAGDDVIRAGAVYGLGLMDTGFASAAGPWLAQACADPRLPLELSASLPATVAALMPDGAVTVLLPLLTDPDASTAARQSAAVALGMAGELDDDRARHRLVDLASGERDAGVRRLALLSLVGMDPGAGDTAAARDEILALLERAVSRPEHDADRPWSALAAGLWLRSHASERGGLDSALLQAFDEEHDPGARGALALALGLAGVGEAGDRLRHAFAETHDEYLAGHLAVALGLLAERDAAPALLDVLLDDGTTARLRVDLAEALRLIDDPDTARRVATAFCNASTSETRRGLAGAMGALRHRDALAALLQATSDSDLDTPSRARACAALGRLAEKTEQPWSLRLTARGNALHPNPVVAALAHDG